MIFGSACPFDCFITSPTNNEKAPSNIIEVYGTVTDGAMVTAVHFQLNNGPWFNVFPQANYSSWYYPLLPLSAGTNTFSAYAIDANGSYSKTNTVIFQYVVNVPLIVRTNGSGTINPVLNRTQQIGVNLSMTAKATKSSGLEPASRPKLQSRPYLTISSTR